MQDKNTFVMNGEKYHLVKGKWYNSQYMAVTKEELYKLNAIRIKNLTFENKTIEELIEIAQSMKDNDDLVYSRKLFEDLLFQCHDISTIRSILPRYTSILRKLQNPDVAIEISKKYIRRFGQSVGSSVLYTSLAGAYCDMGDYAEARHQANKAFAMSNGNASIELQSVYDRINKTER